MQIIDGGISIICKLLLIIINLHVYVYGFMFQYLHKENIFDNITVF